jgi:hypothetical protein
MIMSTKVLSCDKMAFISHLGGGEVTLRGGSRVSSTGQKSSQKGKVGAKIKGQ